jgi:hypothetical protein
MATFTLITDAHESVHVSQHEAAAPADALRLHIFAFPYDDASGPFDHELEWLQEVASGASRPTLVAVHGCRNTWTWLEGAQHEPQYLTYIVQTDAAA